MLVLFGYFTFEGGAAAPPPRRSLKVSRKYRTVILLIFKVATPPSPFPTFHVLLEQLLYRLLRNKQLLQRFLDNYCNINSMSNITLIKI